MVGVKKAHSKWAAIALAIMLSLGAGLALAAAFQYLSARQARVLIDENSNNREDRYYRQYNDQTQ